MLIRHDATLPEFVFPGCVRLAAVDFQKPRVVTESQAISEFEAKSRFGKNRLSIDSHGVSQWPVSTESKLDAAVR